ncbi:hypothetical protein, partial [Moorena sp. SIO4E2]|uniref:hypothetical protein n=1 Tax=Moorena sp. SIO4E2 TaxID=2607826 RepID=UPI00257BF98F
MVSTKSKRPKIWATALVSLISVGVIMPLPTVGQTTTKQDSSNQQLINQIPYRLKSSGFIP